MFKIILNRYTNETGMVQRLTDNAFIPFDLANNDYQRFKSDVASGVELQDPDGNVMTQQEVNDFLKTIP